MKTITVNVSEPVYSAFQRFAKSRGRTAAEIIREAMEAYWEQRIAHQTDLHDFVPTSVGRIKKSLTSDEDLLEEMLGHGTRSRR